MVIAPRIRRSYRITVCLNLNIPSPQKMYIFFTSIPITNVHIYIRASVKAHKLLFFVICTLKIDQQTLIGFDTPFIQRLLLFKIILAFLFELACRPIKRIYILIIWNVQTLAAGQKNFCQPEMYCPLNYRIFTNCPHKNDMWICEEILPGTKQNFTRFPI